MIEIPIELITLEDDSYHLLVPCNVNGCNSFLVIDTGASKTVFDNNFVTRYSAIPNQEPIKSQGVGEEQITSELVEINQFIVGDTHSSEAENDSSANHTQTTFTISPFQCVLIDLSVLNNTYQQHCNRIICGLLGSDFLLKYNAIIDYQRKTLHLQPNFGSKDV